MSESRHNEVLEPRLTVDTNKEKIVRNLLIDKPNISKVGRSGILDQVKQFLPQLAEAEVKLNEAVAADGGDEFDVENVATDENVIEMDIALMKDNSEDQPCLSPQGSWTSDSEDDSSPSPSENSFTSDTDISSSSTCSSSSCDESPSNSKK